MMEVRTEYDGIFRDLIFEILTVAVFKAIFYIVLETFLSICCILYLLKVYYVFPKIHRRELLYSMMMLNLGQIRANIVLGCNFAKYCTSILFSSKRSIMSVCVQIRMTNIQQAGKDVIVLWYLFVMHLSNFILLRRQFCALLVSRS